MSVNIIIENVSVEEIDETFKEMITDKIPYLYEALGIPLDGKAILDYFDDGCHYSDNYNNYVIELDNDFETIPFRYAWWYIQDHKDKYKAIIDSLIKDYLESKEDDGAFYRGM